MTITGVTYLSVIGIAYFAIASRSFFRWNKELYCIDVDIKFGRHSTNEYFIGSVYILADVATHVQA